VNGHRTGENPAQWQGHLNRLLPARGKIRKVENHPALPDEFFPGLAVVCHRLLSHPRCHRYERDFNATPIFHALAST
jgi:hypothetical protein